MPEHFTYLLVDFFCILFPFLFSFHPRIRFYRQWKYFALPCLITAAFFVVWDIYFTASGIWGFNPKYVCGLYVWHLPLEEYLFFICIPYACVFTYHCVSVFGNNDKRLSAAITYIFAILLIIIAVSHLPKLYTSVTFLLLSSLLLLLAITKWGFFRRFYIAFAIILLPFFISNGLLTGSFIREPVVWYNNTYNLGIRLFTIPVEDVFYGMLLMLMNIAGFEYLKRKLTFI